MIWNIFLLILRLADLPCKLIQPVEQPLEKRNDQIKFQVKKDKRDRKRRKDDEERQKSLELKRAKVIIFNWRSIMALYKWLINWYSSTSKNIQQKCQFCIWMGRTPQLMI